MPETLNTRVTRLENLIGILADKQSRLDDVMTTLAESHIKLHEAQIETSRHIDELRQHMGELRDQQAETDRRLRESGVAVDARIESLVKALAELIRNRQN